MESQPQNPEFRNNPENFHPYWYQSDQGRFFGLGLSGSQIIDWFMPTK